MSSDSCPTCLLSEERATKTATNPVTMPKTPSITLKTMKTSKKGAPNRSAEVSAKTVAVNDRERAATAYAIAVRPNTLLGSVTRNA